jgi:hypothetical protein
MHPFPKISTSITLADRRIWYSMFDEKNKSEKTIRNIKIIFLPLIEMSDSPYENGEPIKNTAR